MKECYINIITETIDGKQEFSASGFFSFFRQKAEIKYKDGTSFVKIAVRGGLIKIVRQGDYNLDMLFANGKTTQAYLSISEEKSCIPLNTLHATYDGVEEESINIELNYSLAMTDKPTDYKVKIFVKSK